jgi:hypothetical protein
MTERQRIALAYPCYRAMDTTHPRFKRLEPPWSTILSVNK